MATNSTTISQSNLSHIFLTKTHFSSPLKTQSCKLPTWKSPQKSHLFLIKKVGGKMVVAATAATDAAAAERSKKRYPGEGKGFVEEMRFVAMKLHTKDQAREGEREPQGQPVAKWEPKVEGYLRFLVDSKLVYDTLEKIVDKAQFPEYAEFRNTGLERAESLAKDLEWFKEQGHSIPEPSGPGVEYSRYLEELAVKDPQAFICHFYNTYFAHTAGGRMIGKKTARSCSYAVTIKTSCSSPSYTRDKVSLAYGDAYGNEVYAPRLDDPSSRTFERCSTDTFDIRGPCMYDICYIYLLRVGSDGWKPESVRIYGPNTRSTSFVYNKALPNGVWFGFDHCNGGSASDIM